MRTLLKRVMLLSLAALLAGVVIFASTKETQAPGGPQAGAGGGGAGGGGRRGGGGAGGDQRQPVLVAEAKTADLPIVLEGVGSVRALNTVTVRAQVEGKILKFNFKEGQAVKKGDVLVEIDPTTYKAALDQAVAKRQLTETQLANAKKDLDRYGRVAPGIIAQKTVDTQVSQVAQLEAQVKADQAAVNSAQAVLDYTRVLSPLNGRTGLRQIDEGNIARASDATGLVVITQVQPIAVIFTLPQQQLLAISKAMNGATVAAEAMDGENKLVLDRGTVQVLDNQVDQATGTIKLKAEFDNPNLQLWPGQFVNVRLTVDTLKQVVVVPTPAIQRGPVGPFVFVMQGEDTVAQRPITVGVQTDTVSVAQTGVAAGERVVTSGFTRLQDGAKVAVAPPTGAPTAPAPAGGKPPAANAPAPAAAATQAQSEGKPARGDGTGRKGTSEGGGEGRPKRGGKPGAPAAQGPSPTGAATQTATPAAPSQASAQQ